MSFANPGLLWFLPGAAVPFLLHLLHRRRPKTVEFSHLALIKAAHRTRMPKRRLKEMLLLAARTLIILSLVLLFSRPTVRRGNLFAGGEGRQRLVILLDVSASMGGTYAGRQRLDAAKDEAQKLLRSLPTDEEVGVVIYSDRVEGDVAPTLDRARVLTLISAAKVIARPTNVLPALKAAGAMSGGGRRHATVLVLSDHAAGGWKAAVAAAGAWDGFDPGGRYVMAVAGENPASRGLTGAALELSEEGTLKGRLSVFSNRNAPAAAWQVALNQRVVAKGETAVAPDTAQEDVFQAQLPEGGFYAGQASLTPDGLPFDDVYYIAGRVPKGFHLLLVEGKRGLAPSDSDVYYLSSALESPRDPRLESVETVTPDALSSVNLASYDAIVVANQPDFSGREEELRKWVEAGGGLIVAAGARWPKTSATILQLFRTQGLREKEAAVQAPQRLDNVLANVAGIDRFEWKQVKVTEHAAFEPDSSAVPLLSLDSGEPLLVQKQFGKGNVLVLLTSLDRTWTNLPAKPVFAPMMRELIAALADPLRQQTSLQAFVDEPVSLKLPEGTRSVTVIAPDGTTSGAGIGRDGRLDWTPPPVLGLYEVRTDRPDKWFRVAVNLKDAAGESDLRVVREGDLRAALPGAAVQFVPFKAGSNAIVDVMQGKDVTEILIVFIFLLLVAESFLSRRRPTAREREAMAA